MSIFIRSDHVYDEFQYYFLHVTIKLASSGKYSKDRNFTYQTLASHKLDFYFRNPTEAKRFGIHTQIYYMHFILVYNTVQEYFY